MFILKLIKAIISAIFWDSYASGDADTVAYVDSHPWMKGLSTFMMWTFGILIVIAIIMFLVETIGSEAVHAGILPETGEAKKTTFYDRLHEFRRMLENNTLPKYFFSAPVERFAMLKERGSEFLAEQYAPFFEEYKAVDDLKPYGQADFTVAGGLEDRMPGMKGKDVELLSVTMPKQIRHPECPEVYFALMQGKGYYFTIEEEMPAGALHLHEWDKRGNHTNHGEVEGDRTEVCKKISNILEKRG